MDVSTQIRQRYRIARQELLHLARSRDLIPSSRDFRKFVMLGMGRCGTNLLASSLRSHHNIVSFGEIFNNANRDRILWECPGYVSTPRLLAQRRKDPVEFINSSVYTAMPRNIEAVGFKLFYYHAQEADWYRIWPYLRSLDIKILHVKRRNLLALHLSMTRAKATHEWATRSDNNSASQEPLRLPCEDCLNAFETITHWQKEADAFFEKHDMMDVYYEDIVQNYTEQMARVQDFLEVDFEPTTSPLKKQSRLPLSQAIINYKELKEYFAGSRWEAFFKDQGS